MISVPFCPLSFVLDLGSERKGVKHMRKRVIAMVLALLLTHAIPAFAEMRSIRANPVLSFSGTTAYCSVPVRGNGEIEVTMELWKGGILIASWYGSGTNSLVLSGTASVSHGQTYTLTASGTVGGIAINATPVTKTCP